MADQNKTVKLLFEFDTKGKEKVSYALAEEEKGTLKVQNASQKLFAAQKALNEQAEVRTRLLDTLKTKLEKIHSTPRLNDVLKINAANTTLTAFNRQLDETNQKIHAVRTEINKINFAANLGIGNNPSRATPPANRDASISPYSGLSVNTETRTQAAKRLQFIQDAEERITKVRKAEAEKRQTLEKIEEVNRTQIYKRLFTEAEEKEKELARGKKEALDKQQFDTEVYRNNQIALYTKLFEEIEEKEKISLTDREQEYKRLFDEAEAIEKEFAAKTIANQKKVNDSLRTGFIGKDDRGYVSFAQGTVAEARAKKDLEELTSFKKLLQEREALLQASINKQTAIEQHGINSIEVKRVEAAEKTRVLNNRLAISIEKVQQKVAAGAISASKGIAQAAKLQTAYANSVLKATKELNSQEKAHEESIKTQRNLIIRIGEIIGIYRIYNFIINSTVQAIKSIPRIGIQLESTFASLSSTVGSSAGAVGVLQALNKEADRTGISISALRDSFKTFQASTSLAGESLQTTWQIFTDINTVSTALHKSVDETNSIFLALAQIFNKTKVQSEELVKQLGNLLPGAFASFAAANRDMFENTQDLVKKLQAGVVTAHDTVANFAAFLADRFGTAFVIASQALNAELGRLQTNFILLGEAIYNTSRGPLITIVKGLSEFAKYLTEAVRGNNNFLVILKEVIKFGFIYGAAKLLIYEKSLLTTVTATQRLTVASAALKGAMAFLTNPALILAGIASIALALRNLANETHDASINIAERLAELQERLKQLKDKDSISIAIKIENDPSVKLARDTLADINANIDKLQRPNLATPYLKTLGPPGNAIIKGLENIQKKDLARAYAERSQAVEDLEAAIFTVRTSLLKNQLDTEIQQFDAFEKKRTQLAIAAERARGNAIVAARLQTEQTYAAIVEEANKILDKEKQRRKIGFVGPLPEFESKKVVLAKKVLIDYNAVLAEAGQNTSRRNTVLAREFKEISVAAKESAKTQKLYLDNLTTNYGKNLISFKDYFKEKQALIAQDIEQQLEYNNKALAIALGSNDKAKIAEFRARQNELFQEAQARQDQLAQEKYQALEQYIALQRQSEEEYLSFLGKEGEAEKSRIREAFRTRLQVATVNAQDNPQLFNQETKLRQEALLRADINEFIRQKGLLEQDAARAEERIAIQRDAYSIDEFTSLIKIDEARQQYINRLEEQVIAVENAYNPELDLSGQLKRSIDNARVSLERFKLESNATATYVKSFLGNALANSFLNFVTGAANAEDAMRNFATTVLQEVARIAAERLALQIINLFVGALTSTGSTNSYASIDAFGASYSGSNPVVTTDKGNIFAEGNIIPFAKGGIPDIGDKLQYFPLASGGIGSLREKGPEAVLPLKRNGKGELGVESSGSSSNIINIEKLEVNVQEKEDSNAQQQAEEISKAIRIQLREMIRGEISTATRPGNILNPTQAQGVF